MSVMFVIGGACEGAAWGSEPEYQDRRHDYPDSYQGYPLINLDLKTGVEEVRFLRYEEQAGTTKHQFDKKTVHAGSELAIRGYWISKSLIESYRRKHSKEEGAFSRGPDYPSYDEILKAFRASDQRALVGILGRLAELRSSSESGEFGTGMIEVEDPSATGADSTKRRFIPLSLIKTGEISIQPEQARVKVLKSIVMTVVSESLLQDTEKLESELLQVVASIGCRASPCTSKGEVFSQVIEAVLKAGLVDNSMRFDMMDDKYEEKLNRAETEKLKRILKDLRKACLP